MALTKSKRRLVLEKSQGRCAYCRRSLTENNLTIDHIRPKSSFPKKGDADGIDNLCACCKACNAAKAAMSVKEFRSSVNRKNGELMKLEANRRKAIALAKHLSQEIEGKKYGYIRYLRKLAYENFLSSL